MDNYEIGIGEAAFRCKKLEKRVTELEKRVEELQRQLEVLMTEFYKEAEDEKE